MAKKTATYKAESSEKEVKSDLSRKNETVEVRKIKNGYIARHSWQEGSGSNTEYKNEEVYYDKNPL